MKVVADEERVECDYKSIGDDVFILMAGID